MLDGVPVMVVHQHMARELTAARQIAQQAKTLLELAGDAEEPQAVKLVAIAGELKEIMLGLVDNARTTGAMMGEPAKAT